MFIAIELPEEVVLSLSRFQEKLKAAGDMPLRWVDPRSIHLTLKFLGNVDTGITGKIASALSDAVKGMSPFSIEVGGPGVFPNPRHVQVVWVGLTGELEKLAQLQKRIEASLIPLGFPPEARAFSPHLTLARVRDYAGADQRQQIGQRIEKTDFNARHIIKVDAVQLMRSQLMRQGPIYSRIDTIELK